MDIDKFNFLLFLSTTRGKDSTGVMTLIRDGYYNQKKDVRYHFFKSPVAAWNFTNTIEYNSMVRVTNTKGFMGHTRAATVGAVNSDNAHPFESAGGNIIGSHNGTLYGDYPFKKEGRTDSEALMNLIEAEGLKGLAKINGAWAITFLDVQNETFNLIRNKERPLHYMFTGAGDFIYASEKWMLEAFKGKFDYVTGDIVELKPYELLSFDLSEDVYLKAHTLGPVEGLEAPKVHSYSGTFRGAGSFHYGDWEDYAEGSNLHWKRPGENRIQASDWSPPKGLGEDNTDKPASVPRTRSGGVSVAAATRATARNLIEEAKQKREERVEKAKEKALSTGKVLGFSQPVVRVRSNLPVVVPSESKTKPRHFPFQKGLKEKQRIVGSGEIEVETLTGVWISMEEFLHLLDYGKCKWTNEPTAVSDRRIWLNKTEWISESAWEDPEIQKMYGQDPAILNQLLSNG